MLVLNDQLRHHLEHWDDEPSDDEIVDKENSGKKEELKDYNGKESKGAKESKGMIHVFEDQIVNIKQYTLQVRESVLLFMILLYLLMRERFTIHSPEMLVLLLSVLKMMFDHQQLFWPLTTRSKERSPIIKQQRLVLSDLLARNGAPPMNQSGDEKLLPEQQAVAKVYKEYLSVVDDSLERLESATSISLGLGIWSPAVHRVRSDKKRFIASRSKRILAHGLLHSLNYSKVSGDDDEEEAEPAVVTLSWLQYIRRQKLPLALTEHLEKIATSEELQKYRYCIEENTAYLRACFLDIKNISKKEPSSLELIAQQLHAAEIALWAYCGESQSDDSRRRHWLEEFDTLLKVAQAIHDDVLKDAEKEDSRKEIETEHLSTAIEKQDSPASFEDLGDSPSFSNRVLKTELDGNQTLVYSGKGSLPQNFHQCLEPGIISQSNNIRTKAMLFQELRSRLAEFDKVPEISICPEDDDTNECDVKADRLKNNEGKWQMFTLSGNLLSELQSSIGSVSKDDNTIG